MFQSIHPGEACRRSGVRPRPAFALVLGMGLAASMATPWARGDTVDFERSVAPVLLNRCLECHNATDKNGGLDLSSGNALSAGGKNGAAVVPGQAEESLLLQRVVDGEMPPKKQGKARPLPEAERKALSAWIASGAAWPAGRVLDPYESTSETRGGRDWWSLQPIARPAIPPGTNAANPIDAFVLAQLAPKGWTLAPPADRRAWVRRVYVDLVGYPPSYDEVEAFLADRRADADARLVDRLLASPHFGERWGRYWLDVVRYADTCGYERDQPKPNAWKYRDWVIQAFNDDMPYDRFVTHQLAGDEVADRSAATLVATGFLRLGTWNDEPNDPNEYKYERLEDMVNATSTAFLAFTVKCARCHDHKFDPVRQTDYYRMAAAFWAGPIEPGPREWLGGPDPKRVGTDLLVWTDQGRTAPPLHLLKKGEPNHPGPVVEPGQLSMIPSLDRPVASPSAEATTSQRRLQLARWITDRRNPLTARVWVNRIWQHHMGQGLVRSPDNFGFTGEKPTHPALLDWLASELIDGGWTAKRIHRMIVLSQTYGQASVHPKQDEYNRVDAGNRLAWHAERRRLDAESLRDALLAAGGVLDRSRIGGPAFAPDIAPEALEGLSMKDKAWTPSPPGEQRRRAVYSVAKRGLLPPLLTAFDFPDTTLPCGQRDTTLVAPQALALLNNALVHEQSQRLGRQSVAGTNDPDRRIVEAWRRVLARDPRPGETAAAREHLAQQENHFATRGRAEAGALALASLYHVLLNSNEFLYVD
ncbi:MAG: PSD1 and planctomycete cytochrome C domain-containing protein [Isosphaeraceae bacterium]